MPQEKKVDTSSLRWIVLLLILTAFCSACGYTVRGSGLFLSNLNIKSVYIPLFKNSTTRFELDLKLTQAIVNEFISRGNVTVVPNQEGADAILEGEVLGFGVNPIAYSGVSGSADRYSITITASVTLRDLRKNAEVFSNPSYVYQGEYQVLEGTDFESQQTEAMVKIAELFARNLVISILEGF